MLHAEPGAMIGLGLREKVSKEALRSAAIDGSIVELIDWRPVQAGDFFYSPAGTVHAIGAGLSLVEIQQNLDLTYRLYDYGRGRALHLDEGIEAARPEPWHADFAPRELGPDRTVLAAGGAFVVERWRFDGRGALHCPDGEVLLIPLAAEGMLDGDALVGGSVWGINGEASLVSDAPVDVLVAYPGAYVRQNLMTRRA